MVKSVLETKLQSYKEYIRAKWLFNIQNHLQLGWNFSFEMWDPCEVQLNFGENIPILSMVTFNTHVHLQFDWISQEWNVKSLVRCKLSFQETLWEQMAEFLQSEMWDHCEVRLIFRDNKFWAWWLSIYTFTYSSAEFLKSQMGNPLRNAALLCFPETCERKWLNFSRMKCEILIWCSSVSKKLVREIESLWLSLDMNDPSQVLWWIQVPLTALQIGQVLKSLPI
jgi:hypothetical protein